MALINYKGIVVENIENAQSEEIRENEIKQKLLQKIIAENGIEAPQDMVDEEMAYRTSNLDYQLKYYPDEFGDYLQFTQHKLPKLMEEMKAEVIQNVKIYQLLSQVAEIEKLTVSKEEMEIEIIEIAKRQEMTVEMVKNFLGEEPESVKNDLLLRKAEDLIYQNAKIISC